MNIWFNYHLGKVHNVAIKLQIEQKTEIEAMVEAIKELQREIIKRESPPRLNNWI